MGKEDPAIIVGAGIGGLASALALKRAGIEVTVFERTQELQEVGAGLTLWANAIKVLHKLALEEITHSAYNLADGNIYSWKGQRLSSLSAAALKRRFGATNLAIHRADLQTALLAAVGPEKVRLNHQLCDFKQDKAGVTAHFSNGVEARGRTLIGADGLYSSVRTHLFGETQPRYAGYTAWRGVVAAPLVDILVGEYWGSGKRFGMVPLSGNRVYWFATNTTSEGMQEGFAGRKQEVLSLFADWYPSIPALIEATPESEILRNDIYDRPPLPYWTRGRVTLLGDAAHPMTPNLGQGACQALEDALVLAQCLEHTENVPVALQLYQARRIQHTTQVVVHSRTLGRIGQWKSPLACWLRDNGLKYTPKALQLVTVEQAVGHEV